MEECEMNKGLLACVWGGTLDRVTLDVRHRVAV